MDINNLAKEIKNMQLDSEKNQREAKYYKDRYETLRDEVLLATNKLSVLLGEKILVSKQPGTKKIGMTHSKSQKIWKDMKDNLLKEMIVDRLDVTTQRLGKELEDNGFINSSQMKCKLRKLIFEYKGIKTKQDMTDKISKVLYYDENYLVDAGIKTMLIQKFGNTVKEKIKKEPLGDIKIENISHMG